MLLVLVVLVINLFKGLFLWFIVKEDGGGAAEKKISANGNDEPWQAPSPHPGESAVR
jgi:hypothetical protein